MKFSFLSALALAAMSNLASGTVVNIDFNSATSATYVGQAAAPDLAGGATATWNPLLNVSGTASSTNLNDSTGAATAIDFSLSGLTGTTSTAASEAELGGGYLSLMRDSVYVDSASSTTIATATGTFSGLVVGATYDIYFYGQGQYMSTSTTNGSPAGYRGQNSYFEVGGTGKQTGWDGTVGGNGTLVEGIEYVKFTAIAADGGVLGGVINFDLENVVPGGSGNVTTDNAPSNTGLGARRGAINAIQLVHVVPEPSSALLGLLGAFGLLRRRR